MRGHRPLVAMRMRGITPKAVDIWVGTDSLKTWADWPQHMPGAVVGIEVSDRDRLSSLAPELRCIVGMLVMVGGQDVERVWAVAELCAQADAQRVVAMWHAPNSADSHGIRIDKGDSEWLTF